MSRGQVHRLTDDELLNRINEYTWYHIIKLNERVSTPGVKSFAEQQRLVDRALGGLDLRGKRVLDIGCRDGLFSFQAEKQGAAEVVAVDHNLSRGAAEFLVPYFESRVQFEQLNLLDLTPEKFGRFDVIIFVGVLYHLRYPMWSLQVVHDLLEDHGQVLIETALLLDDNQHALLYCPTGAESPYEPSSVTFFNLKGLEDTVKSMGLEPERRETLHAFQPTTQSAWQRILDAARNTPSPMGVTRGAIVCRRAASHATNERLQYWQGTFKPGTDGGWHRHDRNRGSDA